MYERAFGKLLHSNEEVVEEPQQSAVAAASEVTICGTSARSKTSISAMNSATELMLNDNSKGSGASGEGDKSDDAKKGKNINTGSNIEATALPTSKSVQFQRTGAAFSQDSADDSSPTDDGGTSRSKASAREARSKRRQAMIDDASIVPGTEILAGKRKLPPPPGGNRSKQYKHSDTQYAEDGEVVKVKLLTGTLYLYRGAQRRVEFVRRV